MDFAASPQLALHYPIKINCHKNRLVVFPYPRDKEFGVSLDLKAIATDADLTHVRIRALAAGDQRDLGPVEFKREDKRLVFEVGTAKAGRYEVSW